MRRAARDERLPRVEVAEAMAQLGGVAYVRNLIRLTSARQIRAAVEAGELVRVGRGRYRTKEVDKAFRRAVELRGMVSHLSAAAHYGWEMPYEPGLPWVSVPRNRQVPKPRRAHVVWADLSEEAGFVTSKLRTVIDSARRCEFAVALSVADSAIRAGDVDPVALVRAAAEVRGKGAEKARRVAAAATGKPANAFESTLLAFALDAGLAAEPQVEITVERVTIRPDVVDRERQIRTGSVRACGPSPPVPPWGQTPPEPPSLSGRLRRLPPQRDGPGWTRPDTVEPWNLRRWSTGTSPCGSAPGSPVTGRR